MELVLVFVLVSAMGSCGQQTSENSQEIPVVDDSLQAPQLNAPPPFTISDAEGLIGKYYNQQNQLAKYAYYKTVATKSISIDSTYHKDTILVTVSSYGRIWNNPNKDTLTVHFMKDVELKVYRYHQIWWADKLQAPGDVNLIPEPVKK